MQTRESRSASKSPGTKRLEFLSIRSFQDPDTQDPIVGAFIYIFFEDCKHAESNNELS